MSPLIQDIIALALVVACGGWALWQVSKTLRGKKSKLGSCCSKGCGCDATGKTAGTAVEGQGPAPVEKIHFLPSDMLRKR